MLITSKSNELVKKAVKLQDKKYRELYNQFLVENEKVLFEVIKNGYRVEAIFYCEELTGEYFGEIKLIETTKDIMKLLSSTSTSARCVAVVDKKEQSGICIKSNFLVLDRLQDPSNVGAIIRSALGADFTTVLLIGCADIFDTKVIRSSMGAIFNLNVIKVELDDVLALDYPLVVMDMKGENVYRAEFDCEKIYGFVVGNEGQGVCSELKQRADRVVSIPMNEKLESLNASISASLVMYAISRKLKENI